MSSNTFRGYSAAPMMTGMGSISCVLDDMKAAGYDVDDFDALAPALEAGSAKAVNIVLMGHFAACTDISKDHWTAALKKVVRPQFLDMNLKAFDLGYGA